MIAMEYTSSPEEQPGTHTRNISSGFSFESKEGKIVFPDRPTEYPCSYAQKKDGTAIAFTNQNGWRFVIRVPRHDEGSWSASKDADTVSGHAIALFGD